MKFLLSILPAIILIAACTKDPAGPPERPANPYARINEAQYEKGVLRIKLKEEVAEALSVVNTRGGVPVSGIRPLDDILEQMGAIEMYPTFYNGGQSSGLHRKAGLHLWYTVRFDEDKPLTRALGSAYGLDDIVDIAEPSRLVSFSGSNDYKAFSAEQLGALLQNNGLTRSGDVFPYDDLLLDAQWHYYNDGSLPVSAVGSDINLFPAWRLETGKPEVIVSIIDGGIDYSHEDLQGAIWINEAERSGTPGVDDDGNGFIDDIYGWNFFDDSATINPIPHGTHVAGTIAARNNNGKGVCGVAGGDGTPGTGVRVMCCQGFTETEDGTEEQLANAIVYGANNGAVICSNSWCYTFWYGNELSETLKTAIDYFIVRAGMDSATGTVQVGPMKGGLVVFAAGNDNLNAIIQPGAYGPVVAVASMAPNYKKALHSNYGTWVNISAPGGDKTFNTEGETPYHNVLSTLPGNQYGYLQGTSMATPHVSGIAALIVSRFGGPGYTADMLKERLYAAVNNIDTHNPVYSGMLGLGYVDAFKALRSNENIAPDPVTDLRAEWDFHDVTLEWTVTADQNMSPPVRYDILIAKQSLTGANFDNPPIWARPISVTTGNLRTGDIMEHNVGNLAENTLYYVAITAVDYYGLRSAPAMISGRTTEKPVNKPPVISNVPRDVELSWNGKRSYTLTVTDPEGDIWDFNFAPGSAAAAAVRASDKITISFDAALASAGNYTATLTLTDSENNTAKVDIDYTILDPLAPMLIKDFDDLRFETRGDVIIVDLAGHFRNPDNTTVAITADVSVRGIVNYNLRTDNTLRISARNDGACRFRITGRNSAGLQANGFFNVTCEFKEDPNPPRPVPPSYGDFTLYPNPVKDNLNIAIADLTETVSLRVEVYNTMGVQVFHTVITVSPSSPGQVDLSRLKAGSYNVVLTTHENKKHSQTITKI